MNDRTPSVGSQSDVQVAVDLYVSFSDLVADHHADMVRLAYGMLTDPDLARDVVQVAWASAWRHRRQLRDPMRAKSWLLAITANESRRAYRRRAARGWLQLTERVQPPVRRPDVESHLDLIEVLRRLPLRDRQVLVLRYALGMSSAEIGKHVGLSDSGVRVRISRLLPTLREHLGDD